MPAGQLGRGAGTAPRVVGTTNYGFRYGGGNVGYGGGNIGFTVPAINTPFLQTPQIRFGARVPAFGAKIPAFGVGVNIPTYQIGGVRIGPAVSSNTMANQFAATQAGYASEGRMAPGTSTVTAPGSLMRSEVDYARNTKDALERGLPLTTVNLKDVIAAGYNIGDMQNAGYAYDFQTQTFRPAGTPPTTPGAGGGWTGRHDEGNQFFQTQQAYETWLRRRGRPNRRRTRGETTIVHEAPIRTSTG